MGQFNVEFNAPFMLDHNHCGGIMLYVNEDITAKLVTTEKLNYQKKTFM